MLITNIQELRLAFPAHAIDDIAPLTGFLENSELDFLKDKLGDGLYNSLLDYYAKLDTDTYLSDIQERTDKTKPYNRLLFLCQRAIGFDAMARAIDVQAVSLSNMGVNTATTDDYGAPSEDRIAKFKATCIKEAHISVNLILELLEGFCQDANLTGDDTKDETLLSEKEIADLWQQSRYYFLASDLLIPTATTLQGFFNFYENREKFVQMLPDLHYVQEEQIAPLIGEDFCDALVKLSIKGTDDKTIARLIKRLRKCEAAYLEARTNVVAVNKDRKLHAHDEGERHIRAAVEYCSQYQAYLEQNIDGVKTAPWYIAEGESWKAPSFQNNQQGNAMFVMPAMN